MEHDYNCKKKRREEEKTTGKNDRKKRQEKEKRTKEVAKSIVRVYFYFEKKGQCKDNDSDMIRDKDSSCGA